MNNQTTLGPGRKLLRSFKYSGGHPGSKKITKSRLQSQEGKRTFKGCFGYTL